MKTLKRLWAKLWFGSIKFSDDGRTFRIRQGLRRYVLPVIAGGAPVKRLARGWTLEVESAPVATWIEVGGVNSFSESPASESADGTDFDSGGWARSSPAQRGLDLSVDGFFLEDATTGARDAGQERIEVLARLVDTAGLGRFRLTSPAGATNGETITGSAWFELGGRGGGTNENTNWGATVHFDGQPTVA